MKYPIFIVAYNDSSFIPYQKKCIDKFMPEFEPFIINNCVPHFKTDIDKVCKSLDIKYIDLWHNHHDNPNNSHSYALNYAMDVLLKEMHWPIRFGVMDSDVFPIAPIGLSGSLGYNIYAAKQSRGPYEYLSPCVALFEHISLANTKLDWRGYWFEQGTYKADNGGSTYFFLKERNPSIKWAKQELISVEHGGLDIVDEKCAQDIKNGPPGMHYEAWDRKFIHYYAGSNWCNWPQEFINQKKKILFDYLDRL